MVKENKTKIKRGEKERGENRIHCRNKTIRGSSYAFYNELQLQNHPTAMLVDRY